MEKIVCQKCNQESFVKVEKVYENFVLVGEKKICAFCGEEVIEDDVIKIEKDTKNLFEQEKEKKICRDCVHYVINPWTQKCVLKKTYVDALDSCNQFRKRALQENNK
ncbi:hypothetical protein ACFL1T_02115 [Chlamydiota bacterium]